MVKPIEINNWQVGIADSPHVGFADMRNVDVWSEPGIVKVGLRTVQSSATIGKVRWFATNSDDPSMVFGLDEGNRLIRSTNTGATWSTLSDQAGAGQGLAFWKKNVIVASNDGLIAFDGNFTSGTTLTPGIDPDGEYHPLLPAQDDILYGGAGRYVLSLQEVSGTVFTANSPGSYTLTARALDLPNGYRVKCLEELGTDLAIGTFQGSTNITNGNYQIRVSDIFPWDRVSDSFGPPIRINETGANQMLNSNNVLYINAGTQGNYYITNGSSTEPLFSIPPQIADPDSSTFFINEPGGIAKYNDEVLFGTRGNTFGFGGQGVWTYKNGAKILKNTISNAQDGSGTANVEVIAIHNVGPTDYILSWAYGGVNYGIDKVSTTRYTDYQARIDSPYYRVGTPNQNETLKQLEFSLAEPLQTGQGIRFSHRTSLNGSFTQTSPYTFDFATNGAIQNGIATLDAEVKDGIQLRIEMTTASGTANTPKLQTVWIR